MKAILPIVTTLALGLVSCLDDQRKTATVISPTGFKNGIYIDTIDVHGHPHEIIFSLVKGGISPTHSPECWCLKNDTINETQN